MSRRTTRSHSFEDLLDRINRIKLLAKRMQEHEDSDAHQDEDAPEEKVDGEREDGIIYLQEKSKEFDLEIEIKNKEVLISSLLSQIEQGLQPKSISQTSQITTSKISAFNRKQLHKLIAALLKNIAELEDSVQKLTELQDQYYNNSLTGFKTQVLELKNSLIKKDFEEFQACIYNLGAMYKNISFDCTSPEYASEKSIEGEPLNFYNIHKKLLEKYKNKFRNLQNLYGHNILVSGRNKQTVLEYIDNRMMSVLSYMKAQILKIRKEQESLKIKKSKRSSYLKSKTTETTEGPKQNLLDAADLKPHPNLLEIKVPPSSPTCLDEASTKLLSADSDPKSILSVRGQQLFTQFLKKIGRDIKEVSEINNENTRLMKIFTAVERNRGEVSVSEVAQLCLYGLPSLPKCQPLELNDSEVDKNSVNVARYLFKTSMAEYLDAARQIDAHAPLKARLGLGKDQEIQRVIKLRNAFDDLEKKGPRRTEILQSQVWMIVLFLKHGTLGSAIKNNVGGKSSIGDDSARTYLHKKLGLSLSLNQIIELPEDLLFRAVRNQIQFLALLEPLKEIINQSKPKLQFDGKLNAICVSNKKFIQKLRKWMGDKETSKLDDPAWLMERISSYCLNSDDRENFINYFQNAGAKQSSEQKQSPEEKQSFEVQQTGLCEWRLEKAKLYSIYTSACHEATPAQLQSQQIKDLSRQLKKAWNVSDPQQSAVQMDKVLRNFNPSHQRSSVISFFSSTVNLNSFKGKIEEGLTQISSSPLSVQ